MEKEFKIGDSVSVRTDKQKGRIVNKLKPFGTFTMYIVHLLNDGTMVTAVKHELVKGMEDDEFNQMVPTTSNMDLSSLISNNSKINLYNYCSASTICTCHHHWPSPSSSSTV
jgi:uncharacterized membrane protein SpoIIM required for sporulation